MTHVRGRGAALGFPRLMAAFVSQPSEMMERYRQRQKPKPAGWDAGEGPICNSKRATVASVGSNSVSTAHIVFMPARDSLRTIRREIISAVRLHPVDSM